MFLALFDPRSSALTGVQNGVNINHYMCEALGLIDSKGNSTLRDSTKHYYYKYEVAMSNIYKRVNKDTIALWLPDSSKFLQKIADTSDNDLPLITKEDIVIKISKKGVTYKIPAYKNFYYVNSELKHLKTVTVWVDKTKSIYIPKSLAEELK